MNDQIGTRGTQQRQAILEVIRHAAGPLTVDEIHERAGQSLSRGVGIATVYRTIKLLLESELITQVTLPDGQARYEAADLGHHHHFRCVECGQVVDLEICPVSVPKNTILPGGYRVLDHELTLFGICPQCGGDAEG